MPESDNYAKHISIFKMSEQFVFLFSFLLYDSSLSITLDAFSLQLFPSSLYVPTRSIAEAASFKPSDCSKLLLPLCIFCSLGDLHKSMMLTRSISLRFDEAEPSSRDLVRRSRLPKMLTSFSV